MRQTKLLAVLPEETTSYELKPLYHFLEQLDHFRKIHSIGCMLERHSLLQLPAVGTLGLSTLTSGVLVQGYAAAPSHAAVEEMPQYRLFDDAWQGLREFYDGILTHEELTGVEFDDLTLSDSIAHYDAIACLTRRSHSKRPSQLLLDLVRAGTHPIWICPEHFSGVSSIVVAHSGDERLSPAIVLGQKLATAWHTRLEVVVAGSNSHDLQFRVENVEKQLSQLCIKAEIAVHLGHVSDIAELLPVDHLLIAGGFRRWGMRRWLFGSHTETLLHAARGPMLILPPNELLRQGTSDGLHLLS